jgi:hypothetical protein
MKLLKNRGLMCLKDTRLWLLVLIVQVPSLRNYYVASSIPFPSLVLILSSLVFLFIFCALIRIDSFPLIKRVLSIKTLPVLLLFVIWLVGSFMYSQKEGLYRGGTGDDAMQVPVLAMMQGIAPYDITLLGEAPVSPGLGWIILNAPFTIFKATSLFNVFYIGLTVAFYIRFRKNNLIANKVLISGMLCFACWEQIYSYHDLLVLGFVFFLTFLLAEYAMVGKSSSIFLGVLTGIFATSRLVFIFLPALIAYIQYKRSKIKAIIYGVTGTFVVSFIHIIGYTTNEYYQPLHLINRGLRNIPICMILIGVLLTGIALLKARNGMKDNYLSRLTWYSGLLFIPLFFISAGELVGSGFDFRVWEGSRYLLPILPCILWLVFEVYDGVDLSSVKD